jgi:hypothetical protein
MRVLYYILRSGGVKVSGSRSTNLTLEKLIQNSNRVSKWKYNSEDLYVDGSKVKKRQICPCVSLYKHYAMKTHG